MQSLRLFSDVARCHSFSQAARIHGITQSAASQRIGQLEKRLGVTLIDRSVRPLALTEAGRVYLAGCQELLERLDRLEKKVAGMRDEPEGVVRVGAIYSAGIDLLHHVRERFEAAHPRLKVEIRYGQPDEVVEMVNDHACDLGIVSYPQGWSRRTGIAIIPLRDEVMVVVCRPDHPLAARHRIHATELASCPLVTFNVELPAGRRIRQYLREHGVLGSTNGARIANVFDNIDTIKNAVALTDQVSILPKRTVIREIVAGTLAMVELEPRLVRPIGIVYRDLRRGSKEGGDAALPAAVRSFADFLVDHAGPKVDLVDEIQSEGTPPLMGAPR